MSVSFFGHADLIEPKWIDLILASQWMTNSSWPCRHVFRSQMMLILIKLIHSSIDLFFYSVDGHGAQVILSTWSGGFWNQTPRIMDGTVVSYDVTQSRYSPKPWLFSIYIYIFFYLHRIIHLCTFFFGRICVYMYRSIFTKKKRPFNHIFGADKILRACFRGVKNAGPRKLSQGRAQDIRYLYFYICIYIYATLFLHC